MAKQVQVTVLLNSGTSIPLSFPTNLISVQESSITQSNLTGTHAQINYYPNPNNPIQTTPIYVSETVAAIGTDAGGDMFAATVWDVNGYPQKSAMDMLFPSIGVSIGEATGSNIQSKIQFKGKYYYAAETEAALVTAANAGGGGGTPTLQEVLDEGSTLDKNSQIERAGFNFNIHNSDLDYHSLEIRDTLVALDCTNGVNESFIDCHADPSNVYVEVTAHGDTDNDPDKQATVYLDGNAGTMELIAPNGVTYKNKQVATVDYTFQQSLDATNGLILDKANEISANNYRFSVVGGDPTYTDAAAAVIIDPNRTSMYVQNDGDALDSEFKVIATEIQSSVHDYDNNLSTILKIQKTGATLNKNGAGAKQVATVDYLVYTALLSQNGTSLPVETVLQNSLGCDMVWSRVSAGVYRITPSVGLGSNVYIYPFCQPNGNNTPALIFTDGNGVTVGYLWLYIPNGGPYIEVTIRDNAGVSQDLSYFIGDDTKMSFPKIEVYP